MPTEKNTIDTSKIAGYEQMTTEQKLAAVLGVEIPAPVDLSQYVPKATFDKKASEAAALSKQLKAALPEDKQAEAEREQQIQSLKDAAADWESKFHAADKELTISKYTAKYLALGYDEALAKDTAEAMQSGNMDKVFANGEKYKEALANKIKNDALNGMGKPTGSVGGDQRKMTAAEEMAVKLGKQKAAGSAAYNDVMKHYMGQ